MATFCNTDPACPQTIREHLDRIEAALGDYVTTDNNPCGGAAYYDDGAELPWRLLYCDGSDQDSFATADEAVIAAEGYAAEMV